MALIGGAAFVCHMAVSPRWMVHYLNADMLETDLQVTKDGQVVAFHDRSLQRLTGLEANVEDVEYEKLRLRSDAIELQFLGKYRRLPTDGCEAQQLRPPLLAVAAPILGTIRASTASFFYHTLAT